MSDIFYKLRTGDAAKRLHVSSNTVRGMVRTGKISAAKIGMQLRFAPAEIDRYLAASRVKSSPYPPTN